MDYTVAQISENLKISKVTVSKKLKGLKENLKPYTKLKNGIKYIDSDGLEIIKNSSGLKELKKIDLNGFNNNAPENFKPNLENSFNAFNQLKENYIFALNSDIEFLKSEIETKNI